MSTSFVVCSKCGKTEEYSQSQATGWLIAQNKSKPEGRLVIRCPEHITEYAKNKAQK